MPFVTIRNFQNQIPDLRANSLKSGTKQIRIRTSALSLYNLVYTHACQFGPGRSILFAVQCYPGSAQRGHPLDLRPVYYNGWL